MRLAILGYGVEGKSVEKYFKTHPYENIAPKDIEITIFDDFKDEDIDNLGLEKFDVVFRSPSVRPHYNYTEFEDEDIQLGNEDQYKIANKKPYWTSATKYFFEHCPAEIIAVSGTKGKGTTCSMITAIINAVNHFMYSTNSNSAHPKKTLPKTYLVGNIGTPALDVLDKITALDNIVYELSSFQLWDLHQGSIIGVLLRIEPDHLNVHKDFEEYVHAKSTIARYKGNTDYLIYFNNNETTISIAENSAARKLSYPINNSAKNSPNLSSTAQKKLDALLDLLQVPGEHNRENAEAALLAIAARYFNGDIENLLTGEFYPALESAFKNFQGLPHRLEFVRELNGVKYYDDNYSSAFPALDVAISALAEKPLVLIAGGKDRGLDLTATKTRIFSAKSIIKVILIGETREQLAAHENPKKYILVDDLKTAVATAREIAEENDANVLMSPGAASFDMFKNFKDRGEKFQKYVKGLK